ncbi:MAG TPA: magnesium/cobalt transporter CorA [Candidatus Limnocylindrales bacterium]|nr:magnesium/cobalt transporter CorA [Candidatus Limnocylindrales bacterium]
MLIIRCSSGDRLEEISREAATDLLSRLDANLWLHFDTPTEEELDFLKENFAIHHLTIEDIVNQNQRPKIEPFENYVYLAIHPLRREAKWEIEPSELDLLLGRGWIVSVHYGPLPGLIDNSQLHERIPAALGRGADFLLYTLVDLVVDSYFPVMDDVEDKIESLEDRLLLRAHPGDMNRLLSLKRSIVHIRRAVTPQREVLNQLTRHDFPFVRPENLVYFRDVYDHLIRIAEELDSLRDILSSVLEIHLASTSNQLNATMKRLTAYGTIFVMITAIAGIYGMNFKFMPELEWRYGYFVVLGVMAAISLGLYFYFKKRGDL